MYSLINFVDTGSDSNTLQHIHPTAENVLELSKSLDKSKLVQVQRTVRGKTGLYTRNQWVKASDIKASDVVLANTNNEAHKKEHHSSSKKKSSVSKLYFPLQDCNQSTTRVFTHQDVIDYYKKQKRSKKTSDNFHEFKLKNYFISDGYNETQDIYKKPDGTYTKSRKKLHDKIINSILDSAGSPKPGEKPVCFLFGGGSASGKSSVAKGAVKPVLEELGIKVGTVDSDAIKELIPEYKEFVKQHPETGALRVHNESSDIANSAVDSLIKNNKNFIFDGTMKSFSKYEKIIKNLKDNGYEVRIVSADIPLKEALQRSDARAKQTGRKVPHSIVEGSHRGFASTFPKLLSLVDGYTLYDNSQPKGQPPTLICNETGIKNQNLWEKFLEKGKKEEKVHE